MSEGVTQHLDVPIRTKGNWFWQGEERFLIKGISYLPRMPGSEPYGVEGRIDALDESRLEQLKYDIEVFKELGLNAIQVSALDPTKAHGKAMELLADAGIYVLVTLLEEALSDNDETGSGTNSDPNIDGATQYSADLMKPVLKVVDDMANYSNLLGFVVAVDSIKMNTTTSVAKSYRAAVRDIKAYLRLRSGRCPPVGVSISDQMMWGSLKLEYFTAGNVEERVDFFAMDCWGWAHKSSFQISGWKNMVEHFSKYPVPMYMSAFGSVVGKPRLWQEIECLFSPDMTGVFSGGCLYTYLEYGNRYGIVKPALKGVRRKPEFEELKNHFGVVNARSLKELYTAECKDYESWSGEFPQTGERWLATSDIPEMQGGLERLLQEIQDEKEEKIVVAERSKDNSQGRAQSQNEANRAGVEEAQSN